MTDPFKALGLPPSMELTDDQIESAALILSAQLHPDAAMDDDAQAEAQLAAINDARAILANPETRAIALLEVLGGPAASADRTLPDGFLAEMMQTREEIEAAVNSGDSLAVAPWRAWAIQQRGIHTARVTRLLAAGHDPATLRQVRHELNAWRYIERLIEQIGEPHSA